jgi:hypothetical protein
MTLPYILFILACSHGEVRSIAYKLVEVCVDGIWAGICSNAINTSSVSKVLCKQLIGIEKSCKLHVIISSPLKKDIIARCVSMMFVMGLTGREGG